MSRPRLDDPDTRLMLRSRSGDARAFAELYARNRQRVFGYALRYLGDPARAEDVAQETFLRIYRTRRSYRPERKFSSFMFRIASNLCASDFRRKRPQRLSSREAPDPARRPLDSLVNDELQAQVQAALARLPTRQRRALDWQWFGGLGYEEIGARLGLTLPATKSLLHRARTSLREELTAWRSA